jgi:hypothetical protein
MTPARRWIRRAVALAVLPALSTLCACGSGDGDSSASGSPSPTSSSARASSLDDLPIRDVDRALPSASQVKLADSKGALHCRPGKVTRSCPKREQTTYASVTYHLEGTAEKQDIKQRNGTHWQPESASVQVFRYADKATAQRLQRRASRDAKGSTGPLMQKPRKFPNGAYQLGATGTVDYADAHFRGLPGYTMRIDRRYTSPSHTTSSPENVGVAATSFGRYLVYTLVTTWPSRHPVGTAKAMASQLTDDLVERLQQEQ